MTKRVLITGGAGFLGARLAREILKKGELNGKKVAGFSDGIRCDTQGNIWSSAGWVGEGGGMDVGEDIFGAVFRRGGGPRGGRGRQAAAS